MSQGRVDDQEGMLFGGNDIVSNKLLDLNGDRGLGLSLVDPLAIVPAQQSEPSPPPRAVDFFWY